MSADIVLSAADGYSTLFRWIPEKYLTEEIRGYYRDLKPFPAILFISLGVSGDYSGQYRSVSFPVKKPLIIAGKKISSLAVKIHSHDPTLAPPGKTVLSLMIETDYAYWDQVLYHSDAYMQEKERIGTQILDALQDFYPGIQDNVEIIYIATPHTFIRYTGNWQGSYEGWLWTKKSMNLTLPQTLPNLPSFYMAGSYEPDQFPGLVYNMEDLGAILLIFSTGKIICTGVKNFEDASKAIEILKDKISSIGAL